MLKELPSLVILDVVMPVHEITYTSSADHAQKLQARQMNVLACTAVDDHKIGKEVLKYDVLDYLIKPVNKETPVDNLTKLFKTIN